MPRSIFVIKEPFREQRAQQLRVFRCLLDDEFERFG